jgi:hypothetical protein
VPPTVPASFPLTLLSPHAAESSPGH